MLHAALLAAAAATAVPALPARPPDATYTYTMFLGGASTGVSSVSIDGTSGDAIVVKETADYTFPKVHATTTMRYDSATLRERAYSADFTLAAGTQHADVTVRPGATSVSIAHGSIDIPADPAGPIELIADNLIGSTLLVPALIDATDARVLTLAVLTTGKPLMTNVGRDPQAVRPARVPQTDVLVSLQFAGLIENIWYDPATFVVHDIAIPAQQTEFRLTATAAAGAPVPAPPPAVAALPTPQPHFSSREISFTSADSTMLAGTLTVPAGPAHPRPAIVLVHGSGAEDRDETIGPNAVFLQLSNALSNAGYVVLRYDKRTVGKSGGMPYSGTRDKLLADVAAALRYLRALPETDAKRIYVLGHSEGGELVPTVAARDPRVAGIILMAPPALPMWKITLQQMHASHPGVPPDRYTQAANAEYARVRASNEPRDAWARSTLDVDPIADIARVRVPILIVQGLGDAQIRAQDLPRLVRAARTANPHVTVRTFSNDNHLFEPVVGPPQTPVEALRQYITVPARIDPRVIGALTGWLATQSNAAASQRRGDPTKAFPHSRMIQQTSLRGI